MNNDFFNKKNCSSTMHVHCSWCDETKDPRVLGGGGGSSSSSSSSSSIAVVELRISLRSITELEQ